jgi:hypothetical protein
LFKTVPPPSVKCNAVVRAWRAGAQRWLGLSPNHFVDEPSDANSHEQDWGWVAPNAGHHRVEDITEVRPSRPNEVVKNIGRG